MPPPVIVTVLTPEPVADSITAARTPVATVPPDNLLLVLYKRTGKFSVNVPVIPSTPPCKLMAREAAVVVIAAELKLMRPEDKMLIA